MLSSTSRVLIEDRFTVGVPRGRVIGSAATGGPVRGGVDVERVMSIHADALRFQPLARPGWGRSAISYGPFPRSRGLALAVKVDNGHNLSQSYQLKSWVRQTLRWLKGGETESIAVRCIRWLGHRPRISVARKLRCWYFSRERDDPPRPVTENLAIGFYPQEVPGDPLTTGNGLVVHASRKFDNGELWARVGERCVSTCSGMQNLTMYYIVVLRERGAVYYAAALPGAHAVGGYPNLRPVAVDPFNDATQLYASVSQAVLGEIGFMMDTVVHGIKVADLGPEFDSAVIRDELTGGGALGGSDAAGGTWRGHGFERGEDGAAAGPRDAMGLVFADQPLGLIHALVRPDSGSRWTGLVFRAVDEKNCWAVLAGTKGCRLCLREGGSWKTIVEELPALRPGEENSLQVVDHGTEFTFSINGATCHRCVDSRLAEGLGCGVYAEAGEGESLISGFEAHARETPIPPELDMGPPGNVEGNTIVVRDDFSGPVGGLAGSRTTLGDRVWRHDLGPGRFELTGHGAVRVDASIGVPSPGRTIYSIDWDDPELADLDVELTPPGTRRGELHRCRSGMVFMQSDRTYFMVNIWLHDNLNTASVSTFIRINGFDDLYEAIWTCTGEKRITWGVPFRLRAGFDGNRYLMRVNGEPVLYRTVTDVFPHQPRMKIKRVGIFCNWEWGTDTGTIFRDFIARAGR